MRILGDLKADITLVIGLVRPLPHSKEIGGRVWLRFEPGVLGAEVGADILWKAGVVWLTHRFSVSSHACLHRS